VSDNPTVEQVAAQDDDTVKVEENIKSRRTWLRLVFMCIYGVIISLTAMVGMAIVALGFLWVLFTGEVNRELRGIGQAIASYLYEITRYLTFNTDDKPFPFGGDWPAADNGGADD
jgi:hypothetical protein